MSAFQVVEVVGTFVTILVVLGIWSAITRRIGALNALVTAQLTTNHGGSLLDKVNASAAAAHRLEASVDTLAASVQSNHDEARGKWDMLSDEDSSIAKRLTPIETMARNLQETLPQRLRLQDRMGETLDDHGHRIERLEKQVFPDA